MSETSSEPEVDEPGQIADPSLGVPGEAEPPPGDDSSDPDEVDDDLDTDDEADEEIDPAASDEEEAG